MNQTLRETCQWKPGAATGTGWTRSLTFRLGLAINVAVVGVLASFWLVEYRRERRLRLAEQIERLGEEGRVLSVAQGHLGSRAEFQDYIDAYCRQMEQHISPGHHILVLSPSGYIIARAHERANASLERGMMQTPERGWRRFEYADQPHAAVATAGRDGTAIVVSQSLAPIQRVIRRLAVSRALSIGLLLVLVLVTINVLLIRWVRRPIQDLVNGVQSVASGDFAQRIEESGAAELRLLGRGFNEMAVCLQRDDLRRREEMAKAERIHLSLLPVAELEIPGVAWAASYVPAETIGGDYHDILPCPDGRILVVIGDVCGHGVPAALISAMVKALLKQAVDQGAKPSDMIQVLDRELTSLTGPEHFVTFLAVFYDPPTGRIQYVNCGHEPGLVVSSSGRIRGRLAKAGMPLGITMNSEREVGVSALDPGDRLCLWTDGLAELPAPDGRMLGRDRLAALLTCPRGTDPFRTVSDLIAEAQRFHGSHAFPDDVTLVTLWRRA
jgi:sigma-B regulation protein RsbU (phosphoserine phosphatase)